MTTTGEIIDGYDRNYVLTRLRANRAQARGATHHTTITHAEALAATIADDLPGIPPETVGEVLLCAASKVGAMHAVGFDFSVALNVMAYAADNLIGTDGQPGWGRRDGQAVRVNTNRS